MPILNKTDEYCTKCRMVRSVKNQAVKIRYLDCLKWLEGLYFYLFIAFSMSSLMDSSSGLFAKMVPSPEMMKVDGMERTA